MSKDTTLEENMIALLAGSNRWKHYVGLDVDVNSIDAFIAEGELSKAVDLLMFLGQPFLPLSRHLATIAVQCRQAHIKVLEVINETTNHER